MSGIMHRAGWVVASVLAIALIGTAAGVVWGGPLDPPGAPSPTGKTLEEIPGSWSRALASNDGAAGPNPPAGCNSTRFQCVLGDAAVLDRETGLVWQRDPGPTADVWDNSVRACFAATTGGRMGWRMPSLEELRSVMDGTALPVGNPFADDTANFWTQTTRADATTQAYTLNTANPGSNFTAVKASDTRRVWCVRGDAGYDGL